MIDYLKAMTYFKVKGEVMCAEPYGGGHINDTYLVSTDDGSKTRKYILQRINHNVFKDVGAVMDNMSKVTEFLRENQSGFLKKKLKSLHLIPDNSGNKYYIEADGEFYRCYKYVDEGVCLDAATSPADFETAGKGFGRFQAILNDFNAGELTETLPKFHDTEERYRQLDDALAKDAAGKKAECLDVIEEYLSRRAYASKITGAIREGKIPLRVTHNDTKLNNLLIDPIKGEPVCIIDLDTVMPGSILYDFGDAVRFGASTAAEDERDLEKVHFSMELFKAFAKGFVPEVRKYLTQTEKELLAVSCIILTLECGSRFLADHLNGDKYFKISRKNQNLDRAKTQIALVKEMEKALPEMEEYVKTLF